MRIQLITAGKGVSVRIRAENDEEFAQLFTFESVLKEKKLSLMLDPEEGEVNVHDKVLTLVSTKP